MSYVLRSNVMFHTFVFTQNVPLFLSCVSLVLFVLPVKDWVSFTFISSSNKVSFCLSLSVVLYLSFISLICQVLGLLLFVVYVFSLQLSVLSLFILSLVTSWVLLTVWSLRSFLYFCNVESLFKSLQFFLLKVRSLVWCLLSDSVISVCLSVCSRSDLVKSQVLCLRLQSLLCCLSLHQVLVYSHYHTWLLCSSK